MHFALLLGQVLKSSKQLTLSSAILFALRKLCVTGAKCFPLPLLMLLNFSVGSDLLLLDGFFEKPGFDILLLHFSLMFVEVTIESIGSCFRQFASFVVELT